MASEPRPDFVACLFSPPHEWPKRWRKIYVLAYPVAMPLRWIVLAVAFLTIALWMAGPAYLHDHLARIWKGYP